APRRLPACVRTALGRRPRVPGDDRARRRRCPPSGLRHLRARVAGPRARDRPAALPACADGRARRRGRRADRGLARPPRARRGIRVVRAPRKRRGAGRARRARSGEGTSTGGDRRVSTFELMDELEAGELSVEFEGEEPQALIEWGIERFGSGIAISTSFQIDSVALIDMAYELDAEITVFSVDTGRLPAETLELADRLRDRYPGLQLELVEPSPDEVAGMVGKHGVDLFKTSVDLRLLCCNVRKVRPLTKHLHSLDAWITGLRRDQWASRTNIRKIEIDHDHGAIVKLNPLAEWTEDEVWDYVRERDVPYHSLYDRGYKSIGCAPCTRAIGPDEPSRAGRWWWESNAPKECGIH